MAAIATTAPTTTVAQMKFKIKPSTTKDPSQVTFTPDIQQDAVAPAAAAALPAKQADPMAMLMQNHMQNFVAQMTAQGLISAEDGQAKAMETVQQMMATIKMPAAPARTRTKKVVQADCRCMARVWDGGLGTQCKFARKPGCGDYCNRCHKKSLVTDQPLQFAADGKHLGLFWGRIDKPKPIMSGGYVTVQWKDDACAAKVAEALAGGAQFHPFSGEAKKKVKGPRKPRSAKKSKSKKPKARRAKNAFFWFLGEKRAEKKAELIAAAAEGEKVGVADVTKALGAVWKTMDETARAPYMAMEKADKEKAQQELEASLATMDEEVDTSATVVNASIPAGVGNDDVGQILANGLAGIDTTQVDEEEDLDDILGSLSTDAVHEEKAVVVNETLAEDDGEESDGEEVDEHTLANGKTYYLGSDGTLYDMETQEVAGTLDEETNSLIKA